MLPSPSEGRYDFAASGPNTRQKAGRSVELIDRSSSGWVYFVVRTTLTWSPTQTPRRAPLALLSTTSLPRCNRARAGGTGCRSHPPWQRDSACSDAPNQRTCGASSRGGDAGGFQLWRSHTC